MTRRQLSGFSPLSPASLDDIVKKEKMFGEEKVHLQTIWEDYHKSKATSTGFCLSGAEFRKVTDRVKESPLFVVPLFKDESGSTHIMLLSQMQDKFISFTYLEEYKQNPDAASQWASLALYDDFVESKDLGFVRGDMSPQLSRIEGDTLIRSLLQTYISDEDYEKYIHAFNHKPESFNYDTYMAYIKSNVIAENKKED